MENLNPFELAGRIGELALPAFSEISKPVLEEFELWFASKLPLSPKFADAPEMRCVQHLNLYWRRGYLKGVLMNMFSHCLPDDTSTPQTSCTAEMFFGSINTRGDALAYPFFHKRDFCFVPELMALLGGGSDSLSDKVHIFNEVLECQQIQRSLIKFSNATADLRREYENGKDGITLKGNTLCYGANTAFAVATHPLDFKTFTQLNQAGFWDRFHTLQADIHDDLAIEIFTGSMNPTDEFFSKVADLIPQLKIANEELWKKRPLTVKLPPYKSVMLPILIKAKEYAKKWSKELGASLGEIIRLRIRGDMTREVSAYKILNPEISDEDLIRWTVTRIPHFFEFALNPNIGSGSTLNVKRREECIQTIIQKFKGKRAERREILDSMVKEGYNESTIGRALHEINTRKLNKTEDFGVYEINQ